MSGVFDAVDASALVLENVLLLGCRATDGGGLYVSFEPVTATRLVASGNQAGPLVRALTRRAEQARRSGEGAAC